jgi:NADH:ubiquinone oxidoreductase subunit E
MIADGMEVSLEKVYGVATFYAQFSLAPQGQYHISVCLGTACYVKGAGLLYDKLQALLGIGSDECTPDRKFSLTACRCIGACGLAPVLTVNEEVYGRLSENDVEGILAKCE